MGLKPRFQSRQQVERQEHAPETQEGHNPLLSQSSSNRRKEDQRKARATLKTRLLSSMIPLRQATMRSTGTIGQGRWRRDSTKSRSMVPAWMPSLTCICWKKSWDLDRSQPKGRRRHSRTNKESNRKKRKKKIQQQHEKEQFKFLNLFKILYFFSFVKI